MYETADAAPGWFYLVALGIFPASMVIVWALSYLLVPLNLTEEQADWMATKGFRYIPHAGGIATVAMLWYGATHYS